MLERNALNNIGTWELVRLPKGKKKVKTKCMFDIKQNGLREMDRHKSRLVTNGFFQIYGVVISYVFTPASRFAPVKMILGFSVTFSWERG